MDKNGTLKDESADRLLDDLRQNKLQRALANSDSSNVNRYDLKWLPEHGINPELSEEHRDYLDRLCEDFEDVMRRKIEQSILNRFGLVSALFIIGLFYLTILDSLKNVKLI